MSKYNSSAHLVSLILKSEHYQDDPGLLASLPLPTLRTLYVLTVPPAKFKVGDRVVVDIPSMAARDKPYPSPAFEGETVHGVVLVLEQDACWADENYNGHLVYVKQDGTGVVFQCAEEWVVHPA